MSHDDLKPFVIYRRGEVLGTVHHINGDRAVDKAEDTTGFDDLTWNKWDNASAAERREAVKAGEIT